MSLDESGRAAFDAIAGATDPAMVVVTTSAEGERAGCLVGFHGQSSIDPRRYAVWLSKANHTYRVALRAGRFAVHFLDAGDLALAERFGTLSGDETDKLAGLSVVESGGVPLLVDVPHRMLLERIAILDDGGDHVCVSCRVLDATAEGELTPLRTSDVAHLRPGHPPDDRAIDPA